MSLSVIVQALIASGCTPEQIGAAVRAHETEQDRAAELAEAKKSEKLEKKRALGAARQAKYRDKRKAESDASDASLVVTVTDVTRDSASVTRHIASNAPVDAHTPAPAVSLLNNNIPPSDTSYPHPPRAPKPPSPPASQTSTAAKRGSRLPKDWQPSAADLDFARRQLGTPRAQQELDGFRDYWVGVPGQRGTKLDWDATWRNRVRDVAGRLPQSRAGPQKNPPTKYGFHAYLNGTENEQPADRNLEIADRADGARDVTPRRDDLFETEPGPKSAFAFHR